MSHETAQRMGTDTTEYLLDGELLDALAVHGVGADEVTVDPTGLHVVAPDVAVWTSKDEAGQTWWEVATEGAQDSHTTPVEAAADVARRLGRSAPGRA